MTIESITISLLGVDERSKSAYQFFFESIKTIQCELIDDYTQAQICLVDKDSYNARQQYEALLQNYPDKSILVLSLKKHSCTRKNEFFLKKPIKRDALQESLQQIFRFISSKGMGTSEQDIPLLKKSSIISAKDSPATGKQNSQANSQTKTVASQEDSIKKLENTQDISHVPMLESKKTSTANAGRLLKIEHEEHFVGEQPDINLEQPDVNLDQLEQLRHIFYKPEKLLQAFVEQACSKSQQSEQIIQMNVLNHILYFDFQERKVYSSVGPGIIRPLCLIPHDKNISYRVKDPSFRDELHAIMQANKNETVKKTLKKQSWDMESFTWLITLWSSRGRVPQGTDLNQPVYLIQWPNLTRLAAIPHAVRIAALLYAGPRTLADTAKQLGIKQRYVFAFYSACKAIGLANVSRRQINTLFTAEKPEHNKNQSILSKLLGKLTRFSDKPSIKQGAQS
ncbi:MAG: hypothetical protein QNL62_04905 [Gammaproteobacteria bacterium]|nr:hypothetical protein [Gammaproteobacteria bacterium]